MPVENSVVLRRVGWRPACRPAGRDRACRNQEKALVEQQAYLVLYRRATRGTGAAELAAAELVRIGTNQKPWKPGSVIMILTRLVRNGARYEQDTGPLFPAEPNRAA